MIPGHDFGGRGPVLHFLHANGYPPQAYRPLLERLAQHRRVMAMRMRPLWPDCRPAEVHNWRPFAGDLAAYLDQEQLGPVIGVGHSVGGNATLRLALQQPQRFRAVVLLDPVIFLPQATYLWELTYRLGLAYRVHPLVKGALRRRSAFESRQAMFANYRKKPVFARMDDAALSAYVDSLACEQADGSLALCYPPDWEARIYVTSLRADLEIWRSLPGLQPPLLVVRGALTDTFSEASAALFQRKLPGARIVSLPETTHLVPLEAPAAVAGLIETFLDQVR
ncbi:MAG: alpha/beta fold hydrolase [Chloroflexota bacterium]